ncbi:RNA polymerase sigma factor [Paenibacillus borealis]|uniref:RNA polymerase sigma factor n=1 Tax=Paenibacillus borealis TaxID=160799 RepID=UPI0012FD79AF|nr:sigma-70 family RNA polymerase sigma factor [Paenibacillus borealis]
MEKPLPGTEEYITRMIHKHSDMVLRLALASVRNMADAQDICQDVFIRLYKHQPEFSDPEHERAWLIRVTVNRSRDMLRSPWRRRVASTSPPQLPITREEDRDVVEAVLRLPAKYRMVIHLYYFESYSTSEIAEMLGSKESTVRTQLRRARDQLKTMIGGMGDEAIF